MHEAVIAIAREGVSPIVRIPANEAWMVKRKSRFITISGQAFATLLILPYTIGVGYRHWSYIA